ncbi:NAD(P)/FAD-dependent oxidoreductase [bacterium]|nr:NAD(P)/FAD-dependent oxidoreductase [bacterium]
MKTLKTEYLIIGNSASGAACIEGIRKIDKTGSITVISDENTFNYSRPLISYFLAGKVKKEEMPFRDKKFYSKNNVKLILGNMAKKLDTKKRIVCLSHGEKNIFNKLLIAIGGSPIIPEIKGSWLDGVFAFTTFGDVVAIKDYIKNHTVKRAIVIGGGLIGLKAVEALIELGIKVSIVELADRILSTTFDTKASEIIQDALRKTGCNIFSNNTVVEILGKDNNKKVKSVTLKTRKQVPADLVITAIGVSPNIQLVKNTSISINKGILVDETMQTNVKDIYAAGDVCEKNIPIWPNAFKQGRIAGENMAGGNAVYTGGIAMNSVELCGIPTISIGKTSLEQDKYKILEMHKKEELIYKKIVLENNHIVGCIFVGNIERAGIYTGLIINRVDISNVKDTLLEEDFGILALPEKYRKHLVGDVGLEV